MRAAVVAIACACLVALGCRQEDPNPPPKAPGNPTDPNTAPAPALSGNAQDQQGVEATSGLGTPGPGENAPPKSSQAGAPTTEGGGTGSTLPKEPGTQPKP